MHFLSKLAFCIYNPILYLRMLPLELRQKPFLHLTSYEWPQEKDFSTS
jgi:hypothetical protein